MSSPEPKIFNKGGIRLSSLAVADRSGNEMSGSEVEERKRKRKLSNRESARRSRMRKQHHLQDLANQVALLTKDNAEIVAQVEALSQHHQHLEAENGDLRAQAARLKRRLQSFSAVLRLAEDHGGVSVDAQGMLQRHQEAFPSFHPCVMMRDGSCKD